MHSPRIRGGKVRTMLFTDTRSPFILGARLLATLSLTLAVAACDPGDEAAEELALRADDEHAADPIDGLAPELEHAESHASHAPDELAAVLPEASAAHVMTHYEWKQGQTRVQMKPFDTHFCFLTGFTGKFTGSSESISSWWSDGFWWLGGPSGQVASGRATCIPRADFGPNLKIITGFWGPALSKHSYFGPANDRICVLQQVGGNLQGPNQHVELYVADGGWYLGGSGAPGTIYGVATCIVGVTSQASAAWSVGQPPTLAASSDLACGLSRVGGQFSSPEARVDVSLVGDQWIVDGSPDLPNLSAAAICL